MLDDPDGIWMTLRDKLSRLHQVHTTYLRVTQTSPIPHPDLRVIQGVRVRHLGGHYLSASPIHHLSRLSSNHQDIR
jgi:hypothetical protein